MRETGEARVAAIVGPTAVGKTSVAIRVADELGCEIVSVDSRQIYRELDIGTAKPTAAEQAEARHHLIDVADPTERFSAAMYQRAADAAIEDIRARGKQPLLVGGAGLYLRALLDGLFEGPPAQRDIRERLREEARGDGGEALHRRLAEVDPAASHRIHRNDTLRLVRALEVYEITGRPISELQNQWTGEEPRYRAVVVALRRPREDLNRRANARIRAMMEEGLLDEVCRLRERYRRDAPAFSGYGYAELWDHMDGRHTEEKALELLRRNTHRYAKRQLTWFRADPRTSWVDIAEDASAQDVADATLDIIGADQGGQE
ncbi:tRNA (adenosine(37)-N6)-dimethylallyltransferase MiaA [Candidatus Poribacteria bacterium]|nr:tRNA (adenosine(37)-N6)-dimethylallyltransferase MiaA [Candidatus Poribacteria bacterium]